MLYPVFIHIVLSYFNLVQEMYDAVNPGAAAFPKLQVQANRSRSGVAAPEGALGMHTKPVGDS